jgi:hypothetical protein
MRIGLIPLDERPVNTRYPAMVGAIAGAAIALPPAALLSAGRRPADCAGLARWLEAEAPRLDALIVSVEQLGYGGLIAARTTDEPAAAVLARLEALRELRRRQPRLAIYGFNVVTRVSNANDAVEEPTYWAEHGEGLYALSQLLDRRRRGEPVAGELARLEAAIPAAHRRDFLARRLRNHTVNLAALALVEDGTFDLLVLSSDDTSPFGLPSAEKAWLEGWGRLLGVEEGGSGGGGEWRSGGVEEGPGGVLGVGSRLLMYPGADEVGCVLVARLLNRRAAVTPTVEVFYAPAKGAAAVAAYEDGPISLTVERQVHAAGGRIASSTPAHASPNQGSGAADRQLPNSPTPPLPHPLWLGINTPHARRAEWEPAHAKGERRARLPALRALVAEATRRAGAGQPVAIADVAYPNGADPALVDLMLAGLDLPSLAAYGAWNTAGNTVGSVVAQAFAAALADGPAGRAAHERLLLHRLVEDWGYQQLVRAQARAWLHAGTGHHDPRTPEAVAATAARIEASLNVVIANLDGFAGRYRIAPGSARLPWGRTFEVDFELEAL